MTIYKKKVEAVFVTTCLEHEFRLLKQAAKERFGVDNVQMKLRYPWRGPNHTEFSLIVEDAKSQRLSEAIPDKNKAVPIHKTDRPGKSDCS